MRGFSEQTTPYFIAFESYGIPMEVRASSEELLAEIERLLPPFTRRIDSSEENKRFGVVEEGNGLHSIWNPHSMVAMHTGLPLSLVMIESQLRTWIAVQAPNSIFVHAGAVAHNGGAIIVPGESFSGKTTLVAELVRRGAIYLSDEFAVID